ncbi:class I SAM-dependent methyltransferase [Rhizobium lusitanum]|uniref:Class I SAM-dependent methyltransferase n=1 Tax=Rhizobium lusitanum TaxID=293958 RepID=A0A6L9UJA4_9HYPH|nr:class I SAM-dependent methyltransferase [Rhizobium lusitanum]NEI73970.1 class I SAM-dependent methyltransferase [Rhizobium lusitanum]
MFTSEDFMRECESAPRLNEMSAFFSATAGGMSGVPQKVPVADPRLLERDPDLIRFAAVHRELWGKFDPHYFGSIPYRLEEEVRLGVALLEYGRERGSLEAPVGYYILGAAEGTLARTLASMAAGSIRTLSCSPTKENEESFFFHGRPEFASFFLGPFHKLAPSFLMADPILKPLSKKFDVIFEDTTFQMYSPNREAQIGFVKSFLKPGGLLLFVEKFRQTDALEYVRRELQKDYGYKVRFFSPDEIAQKNAVILNRMNLNEVTLSEMGEAIGRHFQYACITWNSGNFYAVAASDDADNLADLVGRMCEPCIPEEYVYEGLPLSLQGLSSELPGFRSVSKVK